MALINLPAFADELLAEFESLGTLRVDTPVIQPAEPFLAMAGEDLRRRIFMTESETGESLCLRPEFTIPVCLRHIEAVTGTPKRWFDRRIVVRLFWPSSATQPCSINPAGAAESRAKTSVIRPYSGCLGSFASTETRR